MEIKNGVSHRALGSNCNFKIYFQRQRSLVNHLSDEKIYHNQYLGILDGVYFNEI